MTMFSIFSNQKYISYEQIKVLFNASFSGGLLNIFAVWLIYLLVYNTQHQANALLLSVTVTAIVFLRSLITNNYISHEIKSISIHVPAYIALTLSMGIVWGLYQYSHAFHDDSAVRNLVFLISFGLIAGGIAILSVWLPAYLAYIMPQAVAIFAVFVSLDLDNRYYLAFTFAIFIVVMISSSFNVNRSRKKEFELSSNNKQLIGDLNNEIRIRESVQLELEKSKANLEIKVAKRTKDLVDINLHLESVIDEKEEAERNLLHLAYHDELTGLPNKNLLVDRINQSIKISSRDNQQMAILFLDLDRFKNINDSLSHTIGDKLLQEVSTRLNQTLREHDTVSRNGGDEFVIVLEKLKDYNEAIFVAKKVINSLTKSFDILSHKIHIGASVGISVFPTDGDTPHILLRNADTAMYRAKKNGGNQLQFYDPSMSNQLRDRLELENELHSALENNEFYLVYQPQVSASKGKTTGVESLLRWNSKKHGEIPPDRFVPLLEETGLIYSVGEWTIREVIKFINKHPDLDVKYSINLSTLQCNNSSLLDYLEKEIKASGVKPEKIEFEITETLLINDFEKTKTFLDKLHGFGCTIALDDFGTGYTSMTYLAHLPIDVIKIDKTLIRNINNNHNLRSIVTAIVTMSKSLGLKNIFEGVENRDELEAIKYMYGDIIQGYIFSKPLKEEDASRWLNTDLSANVRYLKK